MTRIFFLSAFFLICGCASGDPPPVASTPADSVALGLIEASGGWDAWSSLPVLRFDWIVENDSAELVRVRHLWDRHEQRVRVEWEIGEDTTAVALIDLAASTPEAPVASVYVEGQDAAPTDSLDHTAYGRFINDSYWLLAPLKTFDPGVTRSMVDDSTQSGSSVIRLSFGDVGLTPGDQYWLRVGDDGAIQTWTYQLEGDTTRTQWAWTDPVALKGPKGSITFWTRKRKPDGTSIVTVPSTDIPADAWTSLLPILQ